MTDLADVARERYAKYRYETRNVDMDRFAPYRYAPTAYIEEFLGWKPWSSGDPKKPGQQELLDAYALAMRQQHEKYHYDNGDLKPGELQYWKPGEVIQYYLSVDAGHSVGKTKIASGLMNHFLDCFTPSIIYTIAPTGDQLRLLLWKEIITDRKGKGLPGRLLEGTLRIQVAANHFVTAKSTNDQGGSGTERIQGQHNDYLMFLIDEAEAIPQYVFDAIRSMTSGGIASIVVILRNPRTTSCPAHLVRAQAYTNAMTISCLNHPNVVEGRHVVPNSVTRKYIDEMLEFADVVDSHDPDNYTIELPWREGEIYRPKKQFLWRVMGIAHHDGTINTFTPYGRFDAALERQQAIIAPHPASLIGTLLAALESRADRRGVEEEEWLNIGVDVARYGDDVGTIYIEFRGHCWLVEEVSGHDTNEYRRIIRRAAAEVRASVKKAKVNLSLRVDGGGGYASGIVDPLKSDGPEFAEFRPLWHKYEIWEVHNNETAYEQKAYYDRVTEMYAGAAEWLRWGAVSGPQHAMNMLKSDLCDRPYEFRDKMVDGERVEVKRLVSKTDFRRLRQRQTGDPRSPDHGDGFVLAVVNRRIFTAAASSVGGWAYGGT